MRARQAQWLQQEKEAEEQSAAERAYKAMEDMLGKAAAKAWKEAKLTSNSSIVALDKGFPAEATSGNLIADLSQASCSGHAMHGMDVGDDAGRSKVGLMGVWEGGCRPGEAASGALDDVHDVPGSASTASLQTAAAEGGGGGGAGNGLASKGASSVPVDFAAAARLLMGQRAAAGGADTQAPGAVSAAAGSRPGNSAGSAAAADESQADAGAGARDEHGTKAMFASLGADQPANVSWSLLAELGTRSDLANVLGEVAAAAAAKGLPRRLSKKASLKLTKEVNRRYDMG